MQQRQPVLFIGHGDPMNALRDNPFTQSLSALGRSLAPVPKAILVVSAHWLTRGTWVADTAQPETIHDFGGFPDELYRVVYAPPGSPETARRVKNLLPEIGSDPEWGLDHGAWSVLLHLFPRAQIPVFQLSIDYHAPLARHIEIGKKIAALRNEGVLIVGSGNIVHNLQAFFSQPGPKPFPWAVEFDAWVADRLESGNFDDLLSLEKAGSSARLSVPTPDHYIPLLYTLGASDPGEPLEFTYQEVFSGLSMRCLRLG